ncbi:PREDICTED: GPI mannosyltransferase 1 [Bactrocera latifrons]|uniref:GPI alpha-1,4-mannosyltransferase I, catalytic subunit n=1 Tax=Bactrocera latifrons TaxID=174628 RepID=A0A0K8WBT9_BACLA|nr:PREDICTED: GPI mannosyltransferase 1 [Bactrocera latifrons]
MYNMSMSNTAAKNTPQPTKTLLSRCGTLLLELSFRTHLLVSIALRLLLITYGHWHDAHSEVPYTDIDYKVVTDGARHVLQNASPFNRHTYRYSPILAYMQLPNVLLHPAVGKVIYAAFDIFVAILIYLLVRLQLQVQCRKAVHALLSKFGKIRTAQQYNETDARNRPENIARASACFWLYNPLTAIISTRGNGDSFSSFFVILTVYLLVKSEDTERGANWLIFAAGLTHGFAIHLRLYPLLFSLAYYLCLSTSLTRSTRDLLRQLLFPSCRQMLLVVGTCIALFAVTGFFYTLYGWQYIHEAYLYHFVRRDVRHNFSLYFLLQYLSGNATETSLLEKLLILAPQLGLLLYLSFSFGQFRQTLTFCVFALAFVMVTFNSVVTSQYFVWYLALLPLCLNNLQAISLSRAFIYFGTWLLGQALWLLPAYLLEFKTWNTFYWIGAQGALFFLINSYLLMRLIEHYSFTSFKVNFKKLF